MPDSATAAARGPAGFLAGVRVVFARETGAYFDSAIAYVYAAVFLLLAHGIFMNSFFLESVLDLGEYFRVLPFLLALFVPAITMRSWAEERSQGTFELIMTLPLRSFAIVLGKYLAALAFYLAVLAGSLPLVLMLLFLGKPDLGLIASSFAGAVLLGALFLAIGLFISGLTREQIVAFVLSTFACALLVLSGQEKVVEVLDGLAPRWQAGTWLYESVSVLPHYESFCRGVVSLADTAYFAITSAFFLVMNEITLRLARY
jgi:ABC-type transport system involved in multi-copper enzyme maturation permease subunit